MDNKKRHRTLTDADQLVIRKRSQEHPSGHEKGLSAEDCIVVDDRTDQAELRHQIAQLPIESPLPPDEFLNPEDETIVDEDGDIFAAIVECYIVGQPGEEEESSDEE